MPYSAFRDFNNTYLIVISRIVIIYSFKDWIIFQQTTYVSQQYDTNLRSAKLHNA